MSRLVGTHLLEHATLRISRSPSAEITASALRAAGGDLRFNCDYVVVAVPRGTGADLMDAIYEAARDAPPTPSERPA